MYRLYGYMAKATAGYGLGRRAGLPRRATARTSAKSEACFGEHESRASVLRSRPPPIRHRGGSSKSNVSQRPSSVTSAGCEQPGGVFLWRLERGRAGRPVYPPNIPLPGLTLMNWLAPMTIAGGRLFDLQQCGEAFAHFTKQFDWSRVSYFNISFLP